MKQINSIDGEFYVDRCNTLGGCTSGSIFIAFNSPVAWIAKNIKGLKYIANYIDDSSGCGFADELEYYTPYKNFYPKDQVILLWLWDELGIPHEIKKQLFDSPLPIIGINIDANLMTLMLSDESKRKLIDKLTWWSEKRRREKVKHWYQMGGWVNWGLNVYPLLQPALNNFYPKLKGQWDSTSQIWVNNSIYNNFTWALNLLHDSSGVHLLKSISWGINEALTVIFCDACPNGMRFWYPENKAGFISPTPSDVNFSLIF